MSGEKSNELQACHGGKAAKLSDIRVEDGECPERTSSVLVRAAHTDLPLFILLACSSVSFTSLVT